MRRMEDVRSVYCALTALGHALHREPLQIYQDMPRDMAVKLPDLGIAAYLPAEIGWYLWKHKKPYILASYEDVEGVPWHNWGVLTQREVLDHLSKGRCGMLGFTKLASNKGHWIGCDGGTVNNLYPYFQRNSAPTEMTWKYFVSETGFDETGYANINGHRVRLDHAILIG